MDRDFLKVLWTLILTLQTGTSCKNFATLCRRSAFPRVLNVFFYFRFGFAANESILVLKYCRRAFQSLLLCVGVLEPIFIHDSLCAV